MAVLPNLSRKQQAIVRAWLPDAEFVTDLSWGLMDTVVLHLRTAKGDRIVKAGGPANHHIGREIAAHLGFTRPWVAEGRAARMLRHDDAANVLLLDYLPGELVQDTPAEDDPEVYRQAGAMLAELHTQGARPDDEYEARMNQKMLGWLDTPHRIAPETVERLRDALLGAEPHPVVLTPTHGDWHPRNWLFADDFVRAIDFGRFDWRPAFTDFARLAVRQFARNPALEVAFVEGYGADPRTPERWRMLLLREAIGTAVWAYQVGDERFEQEGHRMIEEALGS
ncbi:MAG TPA: aminoglycoside phosphotransferase family protein [Thermomicrobiales bacterium]|nr:aminoglycoside phosphotransferase family protein [Thermomicrobiales bacterium]